MALRVPAEAAEALGVSPMHPKILELNYKERWAWLQVLTYCARQQSDSLPEELSDVFHLVTPALLARCRELGLIDVDADGVWRVHNWYRVNRRDPGAVERKRRSRARLELQALQSELKATLAGASEEPPP